MFLLTNYRELFNTLDRRRVLIAISTGFLLTQVASFPVALALPSIAEYFDVSLAFASWIIIADLLALGCTVFLGARLGDKYGHNKVFFVGLVIATLGASLAGFSQTLIQLIILRGVQGFGTALVTGNANAMLAAHFPPDQRGKAFAVPISASRIGSFLGLIAFALFLQFLDWRLVFYSFIPLGIIAIWAALPLLKMKSDRLQQSKVHLDFLGAAIFIATIGALILSGMHLHEGEESFTSSDAVRYHLPMHLLFLALLGLFIVVETRVRHPFLDFRLFRYKYFTMAICVNSTFHLSMLAVITLVPILVERGFGFAPVYVLYIILPNQALGTFLPLLAGWYYDRYKSKFIRPVAMCLIALGIFLMGVFALRVSFWYIPLLLFPAYVGTALINTVNNAIVMNSLPDEHRGFASGMIETTRQVGHTVGATIAASAIGLIIPAGISLLSIEEAQGYYARGLQAAALVVVWIMLAGAFLSFYNGPLRAAGMSPASQPSVSGD